MTVRLLRQVCHLSREEVQVALFQSRRFSTGLLNQGVMAQWVSGTGESLTVVHFRAAQGAGVLLQPSLSLSDDGEVILSNLVQVTRRFEQQSSSRTG